VSVATDVVITARRGRVLVITLNRPDVRNALDTALTTGLLAAVEQLDSDPELSVGVLHGAGTTFCAGMDLKAFAKEGPPKGLDEFFRGGPRKPLIAAVEGAALGGGLEVALVCDLIVAARDVKLGVPEARVGLFAAGGGLMRLSRRIPYHVAMRMALAATPLTAEEAEQYGLVNVVAESGQALTRALELAEDVAANAPLSLEASKALIRDTYGMPDEDFWQHQVQFVKRVFRSADAKEGPRAFAERRAPEWAGE